jgi:heat shock protein beta
LLKKGYEVLFLTEPVDEYTIQALPEYEGKKFQNVAKEGMKLDEGEKGKERHEQLEKEFEPLTTWFKENGLKDIIEKAVVSQRLTKSPCALVASTYGWSGNMERIMKSQAYAKAKDSTQDYYAGQKKTLEINPRHPVIKDLLHRVKADKEDKMAYNTATLLFETATLRSGFALKDSVGFAERIELMLKASLSLDPHEMPEEEPEAEELAVEDKEEEASLDDDEEPSSKSGKKKRVEEEHVEL